jgi:hypothetical protein
MGVVGDRKREWLCGRRGEVDCWFWWVVCVGDGGIVNGKVKFEEFCEWLFVRRGEIDCWI